MGENNQKNELKRNVGENIPDNLVLLDSRDPSVSSDDPDFKPFFFGISGYVPVPYSKISVYEDDIINEIFEDDETTHRRIMENKPSRLKEKKETQRDGLGNPSWEKDYQYILHEIKTKWDNLGIRRTVVFDVANVIYRGSDGKPDAFRLLPIVSYWHKLEFSMLMVIPAGYMVATNTNNKFILDVLDDYGMLVVVPVRFHDDRVVLELARITGGIVMSHDRYLDHIGAYPKFTRRSFDKTIKERRLEYMLSNYNQDWLVEDAEDTFCGYKFQVTRDCVENMTAQFSTNDLELVLHTRKANYRSEEKRYFTDELCLLKDYFCRKFSFAKNLAPPHLPFLKDGEMPESYYKFRLKALYT